MDTHRVSRLAHIDELTAEIGWRTGNRFLQRLSPYNLNISQYMVLLLLARSGKAESIRALCDQLGMPASSMTHTIDRLVQEGLAERSAHPTDRRIAVVLLTPKGQETANAVQNERREHVGEIFGHLGDGDLDALTRILQTTLDRFQPRTMP